VEQIAEMWKREATDRIEKIFAEVDEQEAE
jgi:hypothetical protein